MEDCDKVKKDDNSLYKRIQGQKQQLACVRTQGRQEVQGVAPYGGQIEEFTIDMQSEKA